MHNTFIAIGQNKVLPGGKKKRNKTATTTKTWQTGRDLHLQSSKVVPGDANARRLRSSSRSLVTWRSCNKMESKLSPECRLSLIAGGGEDASPLTGEPATVSTLLQTRTIYHTLDEFPCTICFIKTLPKGIFNCLPTQISFGQRHRIERILKLFLPRILLLFRNQTFLCIK